MRVMGGEISPTHLALCPWGSKRNTQVSFRERGATPCWLDELHSRYSRGGSVGAADPIEYGQPHCGQRLRAGRQRHQHVPGSECHGRVERCRLSARLVHSASLAWNGLGITVRRAENHRLGCSDMGIGASLGGLFQPQLERALPRMRQVRRRGSSRFLRPVLPAAHGAGPVPSRAARCFRWPMLHERC